MQINDNSWVNTDITSLNLLAGSYDFKVIQNGICEVEATSPPIIEPVPLTWIINSITEATCAGEYDATVTFTVSGGNYPGASFPHPNGFDWSIISANNDEMTGSINNSGLGVFTARDGNFSIQVDYILNGNTCVGTVVLGNVSLPTGPIVISISQEYVNDCDEPVKLTVTVDDNPLGLPILFKHNTGGWVTNQEFHVGTGAHTIWARYAKADENTLCAVWASVNIAIPSAIDVEILATQAETCPDLKDGTITVEAYSGHTPDADNRIRYTFRISPPPSDGSDDVITISNTEPATHIFTGLTFGRYDIRVIREYSTDGGNTWTEGCDGRDDVTHTFDPPPVVTVNIDELKHVSCPGDADGSIKAVATHLPAAPPLTFTYRLWKDGELYPYRTSTDGIFLNLGKGNYEVRVYNTGNPGCPFVAHVATEIEEPEIIEFTATPERPELLCDDARTNITVSITNPEKYNLWELYYNFNNEGWNPISTTDIIRGVDADGSPYNIQVAFKKETDVYCGIVSDIVTISKPTISASFSLEAMPGENPLVGPMQLTCHYDRAILNVVVSGLTNLNNVEFTITTSDGTIPTGPVKVGNVATFTGITGGTYNISLRIAEFDENNNPIFCDILNETFTIDPEPIQATMSLKPPTCDDFANNTRTIIVDATGGNPDLRFMIVRSGLPQVIHGGTTYTNNEFPNVPVSDHTWTLEVYDGKTLTSCNRRFTFNSLNVTLPDQLTPVWDVANTVHVACHGEATGSATVNVNGGSPFVTDPHYSFIWTKGGVPVGSSNSGNSSTASGLEAGDYIVTVTDFCGTEVVVNVTINQPNAPLEIELINSDVNISCAGEEDGTITIRITGGTPKTLSGTSPIYNYAITKDGSVYPLDDVVITQGINGGEIYETFKIFNLTAGAYVITVTDENGCGALFSETIIEPAPLVVTAVLTDEVKCFGGDGRFTVIVTGGTIIDVGGDLGYYMIVYYNDVNDQKIVVIDKDHHVPDVSNNLGIFTISMEDLNIPPNTTITFHVEIIDANGCEPDAASTTTFAMVNPAEFTVSLSFNRNVFEPPDDTRYACQGGANLEIFQRNIGGRTPITDEWFVFDYVLDDFIPTSITLSSVLPGRYFIKRTDANLCTAESNEITIFQLVELNDDDIVITTHPPTMPLPPLCEAKGSIEIENLIGGVRGYDANRYADNQYKYSVFDRYDNWIKDDIGPNNHKIEGLEEGEYYIIVTIYNPPIACDLGELRIPAVGFIEVKSGQRWHVIEKEPDCFSETIGTGAITLNFPPLDNNDNPITTMLGEFIIFQLTYRDGEDDILIGEWNTVDNEFDFPVTVPQLKAGAYRLEIFYDNGCETGIPIALGANLPKIEVIEGDENLTCAGSVGFIEFDVVFFPAATGLDFNNLTILIEDEKGILIENDDYQIENEDTTDPDKLVRTYRVFPESYDGTNTITITVAIDDNGNICSEFRSEHKLTFPTPFEFSYEIEEWNNEEWSCEPENAGEPLTRPVKFTIAGGVAPYVLSIQSILFEDDLAAGEHTFRLPAGIHTVTVTDQTGCSVMVELDEIVLPTPLPENIMTIVTTDRPVWHETCNGFADGSIVLIQNTYRYVWDDNPQVQMADIDAQGSVFRRNNLSADRYGIRISNLDGSCPVDTAFIIRVEYIVDIDIEGNGRGDDRNDFCPGENAVLTGSTSVRKFDVSVGDHVEISEPLISQWIISGVELDFEQNNPLTPTAEAVSLESSFFVNNNFGDLRRCRGEAATFQIRRLEQPPLDIPQIIYVPIIAEHFEWNMRDVPRWEHYRWEVRPDGVNADIPVMDDEPFPVRLYPSANRYELILHFTGTGDFQCTRSDTISVRPASGLEIPLAFTPNEDGANDTWGFRNIHQFTDLYRINVTVFNRGGIMVFHSDDFRADGRAVRGWEGTRNQAPLPIGTYYYVITLVPRDGTRGETIQETGTVTIVR